MEHRLPISQTPLPSAVAPGLFADWRLAAKTIFGFWAFYLGTVLIRALLGPEAASAIGFRTLSGLLGLALSFLIYAVMRRFAGDGSVRRMALVAAIAALPAAIAVSFFSITLATMKSPITPQSQITTQEGVAIVQSGSNVRIIRDNGSAIEVNLPPVRDIIASKMPRLVADGTVTWYFLFAAWCALYIAITQQTRARATERRLAEAETAAHLAQVRALRYQVNPHFLFNTLNSLSSLVMTGRAEQAEEMLLALSTFFRTSLSLDPSATVSLAEEIDLQRLYLDIERARFPDRLEVEIDVPDAVARARVPALILQPLVENAIKYGVSGTRQKVRLSIVARPLDNNRLQLDVTNRVPGGGKQPPVATHSGTGVGLNNVCQRLAAEFGNEADCRFGPIPGGYQVSIAIPMEDEDD